MSTLRKLLRALATILMVPVLLFEEWGWEPLAAQVSKLARLPLWARLEDRVRNLPPWGAVMVFFLPVVMLFPIKLAALFLFGRSHYASGFALLAGAKLVGTAILARLFQLVKPTLLTIGWFGRWYPRWTGWKDQVLDRVRMSAPWRTVRALKAGTRRRWRAFRLGVMQAFRRVFNS
ncbi:hypothetical protein ACSFA3_01220 [Variovorax sp. RHLX14]|uniref:hypothetical protein n=1 Tax=Variovorax sp. RHLX14 TaxID=1259731 RepID=UPI003F4613A6